MCRAGRGGEIPSEWKAAAQSGRGLGLSAAGGSEAGRCQPAVCLRPAGPIPCEAAGRGAGASGLVSASVAEREYFTFAFLGEWLPLNKQGQNKMTLTERFVYCRFNYVPCCRSPGRLGACLKSHSPLPPTALGLLALGLCSGGLFVFSVEMA